MMAVTDADIKGWLNANPDADDTKIANTMRDAGVDPARMAQVTGLDYGDVASRYERALAPVSQPQAPVDYYAQQFQPDVYSQPTYTSTDKTGAPIYGSPNTYGNNTQATPAYMGTAPDQGAPSAAQTPPPGASAYGTSADLAGPTGISSLAGASLSAGLPGTGGAPAAQQPPVTLASAQVQQNIIAQEQARNSGLPSLQATTPQGLTTQAQTPPPPIPPPPIDANSKIVNDLYASIGRTGMGTGNNQIDQGGFDYWKQMLDSGMSPEQVKSQFQSAVNDFLTNKKEDAYSQYVAPKYLQNMATDVMGNKDLSQFEKLNKIFESGQAYGMDDAKLDSIFGKDVVDKYRTEYGAGMKDFITTSLAKEEGTTFGELATIKDAARKYGLDPTEIAKYSGLNPTGVNTLFDAYDKGLANIAKGWETAKTTAGTDAAALSEAEANKAKTMLALQSQHKVTDEDLAKATGVPVKEVTSYLTPIKEAPKTMESLMTNPTMTGDQIRAKIEELKSNPAINGIYSAAIEKLSEKAAKDYSGEYGGKKFDSLNPVAVSTVLDQLKAQQAAGTSQYYQGGAKEGKKGGFGSLDAMTEDMAKNLVAAGITDIRQVGEAPVYSDVQEIGKTYNGQQVITTTNDEGKTVSYVRQPTGEYEYNYETGENSPVTKFVPVPPNAKLESVYGQYDGYETVTPVDPSKLIKDKDGKMVVQTGTTAVNKLTGEPLSKASNYSERTQGNSWSGTFAGAGNTGYNVQFKDGNPIFYTTGASSSDMQDLAPLLAVASFIPGAAPFVAGLNALYAADQGNWKGALLSGLGAAGPLAGMAGASADTVANIGTASKVANTLNAIANKDLLGTIMSGTNLASDKNLMGSNAFNPSANILGDFSTKDLLSGVSVANALANKDYASLANIAAQMSGSKDAMTAAKGLTLMNALKSDNPMAIASAVQKMNLTSDVIGKAGGGLATLPGLIKNGNKNTLADKSAFDGLNGSLVAKMLNQQPPAIRAAMLKKIMQAA